jgi:hypothetical protein
MTRPLKSTNQNISEKTAKFLNRNIDDEKPNRKMFGFQRFSALFATFLELFAG